MILFHTYISKCDVIDYCTVRDTPYWRTRTLPTTTVPIAMRRCWVFVLVILLCLAAASFPDLQDAVKHTETIRSEHFDAKAAVDDDDFGDEPAEESGASNSIHTNLENESTSPEQKNLNPNSDNADRDDDTRTEYATKHTSSVSEESPSEFNQESHSTHEPEPVEPTKSVDGNEFVDSLVSIAEGAMRIERDGDRALRYFRAAGICGHYGALTTAASLLISGDIRVRRDLATAVRYLKIAVKHGQADAQSLLGMLHASGFAERYGVEKSTAKALLYWKFASHSNNAFASTALGYRYHTGVDISPDCETAARHYFVAAKEIARDPNTWPSWRNFMYGLPPLPSKLKSPDRKRLNDEAAARMNGHGGAGGGGGGVGEDADGGEADEGSEDDVLHYYRHSAKRGNLDAQTTIGALQFFGGHGMPRDEAMAEATLRRAAFAGSGDANAMLAHIRMRRGDPPESILSLFDRAASLGNKHGHYGLGMVYLYGLLGKATDYTLALQHFRLAMDLRHAEAAFHLGRMHSKALGVNKSRLEAFRHFQHGARLGNVQSEYALGVYFLHGLGPVGQPDCKSAVPHLKKVAEKGEWGAVFDSGLFAFNDGDVFGSLWRYEQAAQAGIELGQYNAAILLENAREGNITEIEHWDRARLIEESRIRYHLSAQEFSPAWVRSGNMAFSEKKDYKSAVWSYEMGYKLKNAEATFCLGWMYVRGLGVPRDRHLALRYLNAAKESNPEALVPTTVAMIGLRIWWGLRDTAFRFGLGQYLEENLEKFSVQIWEFVDKPEFYSRSAGKLRPLDTLGVVARKENRDMALVLGLLVVLLFVVTLRKRRFEPNEEQDDVAIQ